MSDYLADLRARAEAATPGPWGWFGYVNGPIHLATQHGGRVYVMGFERLGMQLAQPTFQVRNERGNGWMVKASELAVREVDYRDDIAEIDNPDARYIAAASPDVLLALLDVAQAAEAHHTHVSAGWEVGIRDHFSDPEWWDEWETRREALMDETGAALARLRTLTGEDTT